MRRLLICCFLLLGFAFHSKSWAQEVGGQNAVQNEQPPVVLVLTVQDNQIRVQNATPGVWMEVYTILGVKITSVRIDSTDKTIDLNLPKGYYIFKIGNVVRKVVIR